MPPSLTPTPNPWDRQPREHQDAYEAFLIFRDLGYNRNVTEAFRKYSGKDVANQANGSFNRWCKVFRWHDRAAAWDVHQAEQRRFAESRATLATGFDLAREKQQAVKATLEYGGLLLKRGKLVLDFPLAPKTVKRTVTAKSGETFDLETHYEGVDARNLAAAARIGQIGSEMIWAAIDRAESDDLRVQDDPLTIAQHAKAASEAERIWADWEAEQREKAAAARRPQLMPPGGDTGTGEETGTEVG